MRRLALLLAALLACGLIAAGCGDDDGDDGDDSAATTESAPADTTPSETDTAPSETDTTSGDVDSLDEAVEACKDNVQSTASQLSEGLRSDLEELCDKAAEGGSLLGMRPAGRRVQRELRRVLRRGHHRAVA
jgi:hypothetical protein